MNKKDKKVKVSMPLALMLALVTLGVIASTVIISSKGAILVDLEHKRTELARENALLKSQYVQATSLSKVTQETEDLGMADSKNLLFLNKDLPVAKLP